MDRKSEVRSRKSEVRRKDFGLRSSVFHNLTGNKQPTYAEASVGNASNQQLELINIK